MASEEDKALIRRYIQAIDDNQTSDWSVVDDYIAEDFVAHNPPIIDKLGVARSSLGGGV